MPQWTISVFTGGGEMVVGQRERAICSEVMNVELCCTLNRKAGSPNLQKIDADSFGLICSDFEMCILSLYPNTMEVNGI